MLLADIAVKLKTSPATITAWTKDETFPKVAAKVNKNDGTVDYDYDKIAKWLRGRTIGARGRLPSWVAIVGHKGRPAPAAKKSA